LVGPQNGFLNISTGTTYGSLAEYTCRRGYRLIGSSTAECVETGVWVPSVPPSCLIVGKV